MDKDKLSRITEQAHKIGMEWHELVLEIDELFPSPSERRILETTLRSIAGLAHQANFDTASLLHHIYMDTYYPQETIYPTEKEG